MLGATFQCILCKRVRKCYLQRLLTCSSVFYERVEFSHCKCSLSTLVQYKVKVMGKSGKVNRSEPANLVLVNQRVKQLFKTIGWYYFLSKFSSENITMAQAFAQSFDGKTVTVGSRTFEMTKLVIAQATQLSIDGEMWFQGKPLSIKDLTSYLKSEFLDVNWGPTISLFCFKDEWQNVITTVQHYITCEGQFSTVHQYHM